MSLTLLLPPLHFKSEVMYVNWIFFKQNSGQIVTYQRLKHTCKCCNVTALESLASVQKPHENQLHSKLKFFSMKKKNFIQKEIEFRPSIVQNGLNKREFTLTV